MNTVRAINVLLDRGWLPDRAVAYVGLLLRMSHLDIIARIAKDDRAVAAVEVALQIAAVAVVMLSVVGTTELAINSAWHQASVSFVDLEPVHLCAGPLRQSPEGGTC